VAPTLTGPSSLSVNEEARIALAITAAAADPSDTVTATITGRRCDGYRTGTAEGSTHLTGTSITLTQAELSGLTLHVGDTDPNLSVTATTSINGTTATWGAQSIAVTVDAVAPTLTVPSSLSVNEEASIALAITAAAADPSDTVTGTITGLPSGGHPTDTTRGTHPP